MRFRLNINNTNKNVCLQFGYIQYPIHIWLLKYRCRIEHGKLICVDHNIIIIIIFTTAEYVIAFRSSHITLQ